MDIFRIPDPLMRIRNTDRNLLEKHSSIADIDKAGPKGQQTSDSGKANKRRDIGVPDSHLKPIIGKDRIL